MFSSKYTPITVIPRIFTVHTDEELGIVTRDRLRATVCQCQFLTIPHLTLDHERLKQDKRLLFENLQRGELCSSASR